MTVWFTSDTHFHHANIIEYCGRPFRDVDHMNEEMIHRWNERVKPGDLVYHLGDFAMGPKEKALETKRRLNGGVILVRGNHDRSEASMKAMGFESVYSKLETLFVVYGKERRFYLSHIPIGLDHRSPKKYSEELTKPPPKYYDYWLCGHVHEKWKSRGKTINVGVDQWDFRPVTLEELLTA